MASLGPSSASWPFLSQVSHTCTILLTFKGVLNACACHEQTCAQGEKFVLHDVHMLAARMLPDLCICYAMAHVTFVLAHVNCALLT